MVVEEFFAFRVLKIKVSREARYVLGREAFG